MNEPAGDGGVGGLPRSFTKMSGAGNDFLVFGTPVQVASREAATIRRLCRRGTGVGADGVLFLSVDDSTPRPAVAVDYYNADGGPAFFCANGSRCAARFASLRRRGARSVLLRTGWGEIAADVLADGRVTLRLPEPIAPGREVPTFDREGLLEAQGVAIAVGVPHLVVFTTGKTPLGLLDLPALSPPLRHHPALPEGANVNFLEPSGPSRLSIRSWERGVEGETLSCGSGVVGSAVVAAVRHGFSPPVTLATRSGEDLVVGFRLEGKVARDVTLTGDARVIFEGTLSEEAL